MPVSIPLTQGKTAIVDDEDGYLAGLKWCAVKNGKTFYAVRNIRKEGGGQTTQRLHRVIGARMGILGEVDHESRDGLDCRRLNLRPATRQQNGANRGMQANNTSGIKGVSWHKRTGRWQAKIEVAGKQKHLGLFDDPQEAKAVVEAAREKAFGKFVCHG